MFSRSLTWEEQLRRTEAVRALQRIKLDQFPLADLRRITDSFVRFSPSPSSSVLRIKGIAPQSDECNVLLNEQLAKIKGELYVHEAGVLACMHALTRDHARGQLLALRLDVRNTDEFFDRKLPVYLQAVVLARGVNQEACSEDEATAAKELLAVVKGQIGDFPSILGLLRAIGNGTCDALIPASLVCAALKRSHYRANLTEELQALQCQRRWFDAYKLVAGLRDIIGLPQADALLREVFPEYPMWASWRPSTRRIMAWESPRLEPFRQRIGPILDLEGPDSTGQQLGTLRMSSPGAFTTLATPNFSNDRFLLDRMLDDLDTCLGIGHEALAMFVYVCVDMAGVSNRSLELIETAAELLDDGATKTLTDFLKALLPQSTLHVRMQALTAVLPVLQHSSRLQTVYGMNNDLAVRAPAVLSAAQKHLCKILEDGVPDERFGLQILGLGKALLHSAWLHDTWQPGYVEMLALMPSEIEVRRAFYALAASQDGTAERHIHFLTSRLGPSRRRGKTSMAIETVAVVSDEPISYVAPTSDRDILRHILRDMARVDAKAPVVCVRRCLEDQTVSCESS